IGAAQKLVEFDLAGAAPAHFLGIDVRIVGHDIHPQEPAAEFGDAPPDIADADYTDAFAVRLAAGEIAAIGQAAGAQRPVAFDHALDERQQHAEHVFGDRLRIAAGLIDDKDAALAAGFDVDGVVTGAVGGDDQPC